ncbi:19669_t:CDS:2 [Cetraspora pellucida]|uniref:19669_t:CDS:1 n=1 Tax=Cetraspora pellucida TaxID=1433469 RepID=A0A9N9G907_9GLOM|nr:19669_t:CDS:2 [Cetraspora pellucida]
MIRQLENKLRGSEVSLRKHSELETLNDELNELYESEEDQENIDDVFTLNQIEEFKRIYTFKPIQASIKKEKKSTARSEKRDDEAYLKKLQEKQCCQKLCITKIDMQEALNRYREIKAMSQIESNFCFLGMIDASVRFGMLNNGTSKTYLTTNYNFSGISVCQNAWLIIYGIGRARWESLRAHYQQHGLASKIHKLSGCVSNFAIPFAVVLHVLKFIKNFANQHGLPSPGRSFRDNTREVIYLPACESKRSLFRLYENIESEEDCKISLSSFLRIWKLYFPGIKFLTIRNDLCTLCKNMRFGAKYWHNDEVEKKIQEWNKHYSWAQLEREYYRFINYLIPESENVGKGADVVISLVHNYFMNHAKIALEKLMLLALL